MNKKSCDNIGKYISQLYRRGGIFVTKEMEKYNIGQGQFMFLLELYIEDGRNQEELSKALKIDKGTTARAIKKLEKERYLIRYKDEKDKRSNKIYLTQKGRDVKENIFSVLDEWERKISEHLDESEKELMIKLLKKVCLNIDKQEEN
ncbi:MarR family winged helix-turn-helix transcriptional regulator [Terrisporobacter sp.]|uniref:MarR family winged helix-turn-helix transcriptional regulator n=1 Tax=Terrisporobacter sp. TaxID=1965305 RepID=UPI002632BE31|nr:MarR family transcriptional regulator [Terrisporobacter sp.]